jgi:hypothetical protein
MAFFRSALLRRIVYVIAFAIAVSRLAHHAHSEVLTADAPAGISSPSNSPR